MPNLIVPRDSRGNLRQDERIMSCCRSKRSHTLIPVLLRASRRCCQPVRRLKVSGGAKRFILADRPTLWRGTRHPGWALLRDSCLARRSASRSRNFFLCAGRGGVRPAPRARAVPVKVAFGKFPGAALDIPVRRCARRAGFGLLVSRGWWRHGSAGSSAWRSASWSALRS
jgi:hypothetical protein